jgi:hypothetical protein
MNASQQNTILDYLTSLHTRGIKLGRDRLHDIFTGRPVCFAGWVGADLLGYVYPCTHPLAADILSQAFGINKAEARCIVDANDLGARRPESNIRGCVTGLSDLEEQ